MGLRILLGSIIDKIREILEQPTERLKEIGVDRGTRFLDVGCGLGFYSFPASIIVGEDGLVIALDKDANNIEWVAGESKERGLTNFRTVVADACNTGLPDRSVDIVFLHLVLHDIEDRPAAIREFGRVLGDRGKLVIDEEDIMRLGDIRYLAEHEGFRFSKRLRRTTQVFEKPASS